MSFGNFPRIFGSSRQLRIGPAYRSFPRLSGYRPWMTDFLELHAHLAGLNGREKQAEAATEVFAYVLRRDPNAAARMARAALIQLDSPDSDLTMPAPDERLAYRVREAAKLVGVSYDVMRQHMVVGTVAAVSAGERIALIPRRELLRWLDTLPAWEPPPPPTIYM